MKTKKVRNGYRQSVFSIMILAIFTYIALSYSTQDFTKEVDFTDDGRWKISTTVWSVKGKTVQTGDQDVKGRWVGEVIIEYYGKSGLKYTEIVNYKDGLRQGQSTKTYPDGRVEYDCYENGAITRNSNCEKSVIIAEDDSSAYQILSNRIPWYKFCLNAFDFDDNYIKSYLDTFELLLYANEFSVDEFDDYYNDVIDILEETPYDSIIEFNSEYTYYNGLELILNNEFRLATLDSYLKNDSNTLNVVKTTYPNYLKMLNQNEVTDSDFEEFCLEYDSIMSNYPPIALTDTFIVDTLNYRMYRTMTYIASQEENSSVASNLKNAEILFEVLIKPGYSYNKLARKYLETNSPKDVATTILYSFLAEFIYGDMLMNSITDAYFLKAGVVTVPTVASKVVSISEAGSVVGGNVINDGGGEIINRGVAWATFYNPTIGDAYVESGNGLGEFEVSFTELESGITYYFRAYAINSASIAYGNCVSFTPGSTGLDELPKGNLNFDIYPNPVSGYVTIHFISEPNENASISIIDLHGKLLYKYDPGNLPEGTYQQKIDLSSFENGIYFCRLNIGIRSATKTILVSK